MERLGAQDGEVALDIGCGAGATSMALARRVAPGGRVIGVDISAPLLERARQLAPPGLPVEFVLGDATVYPFEPGRADLMCSRFGVMFFADPVAAFANIRPAAQLTGQLVFVCWQPLAANQWLLVPGAALAEYLPPPAGFGSGDGPGMFAFADPDRVRAVLAAAGWRDITITSEHRSILVGGGGGVDDAVAFLRTGSMGRTMLAGADAGTADRALAAVRTALVPHTDDDGVHLGAAVWLVQAATA
jgi:SAM-dependent methyltransferase